MSSTSVVLAVALVLAAQGASLSPARYRSGTVPALPVMALGGGQVFLELSVSRDGRVTAVTIVRTTPPFTDGVVDAVRDWQFRPAEETVPSRKARASTVLVAAVFRPPALSGPTLGGVPTDVASPSDETAFPLTTTMPAFSPSAFGSGVVLLEAQIDSDGAVADVTVIRSAPPFDAAALSAARQWRFRPARARGRPVATLVYLVFGFPAPIVTAPTVPRD